MIPLSAKNKLNWKLLHRLMNIVDEFELNNFVYICRASILRQTASHTKKSTSDNSYIAHIIIFQMFLTVEFKVR